jgi:pimeloyl-ACP methyl ester carboxylesterase
MRAAALALVAFVMPACFWSDPAQDDVPPPSPSGEAELEIRAVDVGGYELYLQCMGQGSPTVILEAGYGASGTSTWFQFQELTTGVTRVCTYDRAGLGLSDRRPADQGPVTVAQMAEDLHALLEGAGEEPPYVLVGHSFGGFVVQHFAEAYPREVAGMVLEESNQVDEIEAYRRADAGAWIEADVRIDMAETEETLGDPAGLNDRPLIVVTAGVYEDVLDPDLAFRLQRRLAELSDTVVHVLAKGSGHFVHDLNPRLMSQAMFEVVQAVRDDGTLPPCRATFPELGGRCLQG